MQALGQVYEVPEKVPKVPEKVWEALVQSQVRFNRVPEQVPDKVPGILGAQPNQVQRVPEKVPVKVWEALVQISGEGSGEGSRKPWCKAKSSSTGSGEACGSQARSGSFNSRKPS